MTEATENQVEELTEAMPDLEQEQLPQVSEDEAKARSKGWVGKEEWVESGKDADDWVNFNHFNAKGDLIAQARRVQTLEKEFEKRLADNNEFHKANLEMRLSELQDKRDEAIDIADKDAVKKLDGEIKSIDKQIDKLSVKEPELTGPSEADIQVENAYFNTLDTIAKKSTANYLGQQYAQQGLSGQALVNAVEADMKKEFPNTNPNRQKASMTDKKTRNSNDSKEKPKYSMDDLSPQDKRILQSLKNQSAKYAKMNDSELLKIFNDSKR